MTSPYRPIVLLVFGCALVLALAGLALNVAWLAAVGAASTALVAAAVWR